jgi:hypothetical protein
MVCSSVCYEVSDPGSGAFLTTGTGIRDGKIRIRDEHPRLFFRELRNSFRVKIT